MKNREVGASLLSMLIVLLMAGTLFAIAFKLHQPYLDHRTIDSILQGLIQEPDQISQSPREIRSTIAKRFLINQIDMLPRESLEITKKRGDITINVNYEVRLPMFHNVDAVVSFSESYEAVLP